MAFIDRRGVVSDPAARLQSVSSSQHLVRMRYASPAMDADPQPSVCGASVVALFVAF